MSSSTQTCGHHVPIRGGPLDDMSSFRWLRAIRLRIHPPPGYLQESRSRRTAVATRRYQPIPRRQRCVGAGSRKEWQPGLATGQCRASSRVTSHMESATLIGRSTPGREPTYYGPHV
eukprot:468240-Prymnesium_polylepis.1